MKHSDNVNKSNLSITNTSLGRMEEKVTEMVLAGDGKLLTNVPGRRGRRPGSKNNNAHKTM